MHTFGVWITSPRHDHAAPLTIRILRVCLLTTPVELDGTCSGSNKRNTADKTGWKTRRKRANDWKTARSLEYQHHKEVNHSQISSTKTTWPRTDAGVFTWDPGLKSHGGDGTPVAPLLHQICEKRHTAKQWSPVAASHRTHDESHPEWRTDRAPRNGSCPHRDILQKRARDDEEDQLYTTGSAPWFAVWVGSTWWTMKTAAAVNSRSRSARGTTHWVNHSRTRWTARPPHQKNSAWQSPENRTDQCTKQAEIQETRPSRETHCLEAESMEVMRPKRDNNRPVISRRTSGEPDSKWIGRPAKPPPTDNGSNVVLHHPENVQRELTQSRILHRTTHSARRKCGGGLTQIQGTFVQSDWTKRRLPRKISVRMRRTQEREDVRVTPRHGHSETCGRGTHAKVTKQMDTKSHRWWHTWFRKSPIYVIQSTNNFFSNHCYSNNATWCLFVKLQTLHQRLSHGSNPSPSNCLVSILTLSSSSRLLIIQNAPDKEHPTPDTQHPCRVRSLECARWPRDQLLVSYFFPLCVFSFYDR